MFPIEFYSFIHIDICSPCQLYPNFVSLDPNNLVTYLWGMKILLMKLPEPNLMLLSYLVKHWVSVAFCGEFNGVTFEKLGYYFVIYLFFLSILILF